MPSSNTRETESFIPSANIQSGVRISGKAPLARDKSIRLAEASPLLENFLIDAEGFWNSNREGSANSPVWIERDPSGRDVQLEAAALHVDGKNVLLIRNLASTYAERQKLYQAARDSLLEHERLLREIQKKEILLHCIIHDLSQPLTAMRGCFNLMSLQDLSADLRRMVETGERESNRQEQMIRGILQAFSADLAGQQTSAESAPSAADIGCCRPTRRSGILARIRRETDKAASRSGRRSLAGLDCRRRRFTARSRVRKSPRKCSSLQPAEYHRYNRPGRKRQTGPRICG